MSKKHQVFGNSSPEDDKQMQREARLQYDPNVIAESNRNWNSYTESQRDFIKEQGNQIYAEIAEQITAEKPPTHPDVQRLLERWHEHLRYFYEPSLDLLGGLGQLYSTSPDFRANFEKLHPDLPDYLTSAIAQYVDDLETAALEQMIAEDEAMQKRANKLSS